MSKTAEVAILLANSGAAYKILTKLALEALCVCRSYDFDPEFILLRLSL